MSHVHCRRDGGKNEDPPANTQQMTPTPMAVDTPVGTGEEEADDAAAFQDKGGNLSEDPVQLAARRDVAPPAEVHAGEDDGAGTAKPIKVKNCRS